MDYEATIIAPLDHPCYAGHFPGNPIVPGVVLLDLIVDAVKRGAPRAIDHVKFHRAVKPGEAFTLRYELSGPQLTFRCVNGELLLVEGRLSFAGTSGALA
jgi:3-hydroxyacyl-[acyl-carrier-protein] dehydratase